MQLLVLGASGAVGQWVTRLAVERGHTVTALVRAGVPYHGSNGFTVRQGDVTDPAVLDAAVRQHDAVISCLGLRRAGQSPWARLLSPPDLTATVARTLVPVMHRHGVQRVAAISAGGVGDSYARLSWPVQRLVSTGNVAVAYRDLAQMEETLEHSDLDWLVVRPVTLLHGTPTGKVRPVERYDIMSVVRRADVAAWLLNAVESGEPFRERRVLLGSRAPERDGR